MSTVLYRRPPRRPPPQMPKGEVIFESPPEMPEEDSAGGGMQKWLSVLPMAGGAVSMVFMATMFSGGGQENSSRMTMRMIAMGLMGVSTMGMGLSQLGNRGADRKRKVDGGRRDYLRYLSQLRRRIRAAADKQREALEFRYPDPGQLWALPLSRRLWERRPNDKDFGHVRLARGAQGFLLKLVAPETKPVEDLDPVSSGALRRFIQTYRRVNDLPVALSLRAFAHVRMDGDVDTVRDLTRAMLAHIATLHAPHEMILAFCVGPDRRAEWDWVKWLPHTLHPAATDGAGHLRFVAGSMSELERMLADQLANRPYFSPEGGPLTDAPHVIVVVDGGHAGPDSTFVSQPWQGTTLLDVTGEAARQGGTGVLRLQVEKNELIHLTPGRDEKWRSTPLGKPDRLTVTEIEALARTLAPLRATTKSGKSSDTGQAAEAEEEKPQFENDLMALLGIQDAYNLNLEEVWKPRPREQRLRIPFGLDDKGMPIELDIKESAQGGMGPHGLVIGATGSGKSEVLRTIVLGLVATHSPDYLNLVLVDFKGGATFLELDKLPHTSAVITNLEGELTLVDRMQDAIAGEMARRQELLAKSGNYGSLRDYEEDRAKGKPLDPMPTLWIVADEFSELLTAKPEFIDVFLQIGRIGRSIGVHLLLASQRLEEGKLKGLDTFLSYRFGLRTFSAAESRTVIGVPDAFELPRRPGGGYLKVGTDYMQRFQAAYVGAPYVRPTAGTVGGKRKAPPKPGEKRFVPQITAYTTDYVEPNIVEIPPEPEPEQEVQAAAGPAPGEPKVLLDLVVEQLIGKGRPAHQVWLPPLDSPPTMDGLLPPLKVSEEFGLNADWDGRGMLQVPVALVDKPFHQRRDPMWLDLSGAGGHIAICGGPQTGKSTAVRALIAGMAMTHTPDEVGAYCLDFGGGTLPAMNGLPHVGGVATRLDADGIRRTVGEMTALLEQREVRFTEHGIDSIATYRRMRRQNRIEPDRFPSDVFLIIDGWGTVRADHEQIEQAVTTIASRGLGFGIHVVATAVKWNEFRSAIKALLQTKLELRQGDPYDSEIDRRLATNVPNNRPGRGITPEKLHFLGALPRIDGVEDDDDLADGVKAMCEASVAAWKGQPAAPVRLLPERLEITALPKVGDRPKHLIPIGIDEDNLQTVFLDFEEEPHLFVTGQIECGKSNLLDVINKSIVARYTPQEAKIVLIDYRRAQLESITGKEHLIGYAASSGAATDMLKEIAGVVRKRLPGPDVTPDQLKNRSWWTGSDLFIIVDDYELVATSSGNPLSPFVDLVSQARDIGLHLVLSRGFGGVGRAMHDPLVQRARDMGNPALIMSGTKEEGKLYGHTATPLVAGRGTLISRRVGNKLIQTAWLPRPGEE